MVKSWIKKNKYNAYTSTLVSVKDELIDNVEEKPDPAEAREMLQNMFQSGDQS